MCVRIGAVFLRFSQLLLTNYLPCLVVCTPTMNKSLIHNNIHWSKPNISPLHFLGLRTWHQGWMIFSKITSKISQNIMIFFYIFEIFDTFDIFDIFQKTKISNKLYNNGCNTLMQYLMTISYKSFVPYVRT